MQEAHDDTDALMRDLGGAFEGVSREAVPTRWGQASGSHTTVRVARDTVIAQLVTRAVEMAAAVATTGIAAAAGAAIEEAVSGPDVPGRTAASCTSAPGRWARRRSTASASCAGPSTERGRTTGRWSGPGCCT
ncbi:hypothetical protein Kpho02_10440 [Kitasatospora phosalacinea]|uniref:Uncharacterized protein n=1 Tax=Kitasatospora phosalacinea TaxID=2065 RepID=A0A9W6Q2B4_9ACTN|nr:hypothetical protein [Kitasatospora phosalacinea]GLW68745.1 hypothetical protein Kpho02_10440 [Kitasatospora phosalacinea]